MVEDRRFCGTRSRPVVMRCDGVEELGENGRIEVSRALLDHAQAEMDVAEEAPFVRLPERRTGAELAGPADVVQQRRRQQEVMAKPRMELCGLAAQRGHADGVLEEAARVAVVRVGAGSGKGAERLANPSVPDEGVDRRGESRMRDLGCQELEEPVQLVRVAPERRREVGRIGVVCGLDGPDLDLQLPAEALDTPENPHRIAFPEALVEQVDVAPDARLDAPARIGQLEREVRRPGTRLPALLLRDREHALDSPVLDELGDRGHVPTI